MVHPVRIMRSGEEPAVLQMMRLLWPDCDDEMIVDDQIFVLERPDGELGGFIALSLRPWAEGCTSEPVAYVEGWWVAADLRRQGLGRALVAAAEQWARDVGSAELASDVELADAASLEAHGALGFVEVQRTVAFKKQLDRTHTYPPTRARPDAPGLIAACVLAAKLANAPRPDDDELRALFDRVLFAPQPAGKAGWACFQIGIILETELRDLLLSHLDSWLEHRGATGRLVDVLTDEVAECFERALFGRSLR